jgi:hypothetical protein
MNMKKNKFRLGILLIIIFLVNPFALLWAESHIKNITLQREGDYTNITIFSESPFKFNHFIEEKKDGKPYRIVIDCLNSIHALQQNNYRELPSEMISAIRTSQYQVTPEKICRIVLDLKSPVVYKIVEEGDDKIAILALSTPQDPVYAKWSAVQENITEKSPELAEAKQTKKISEEPKELPKKEVASAVTSEKKVNSSEETKTASLQKTTLQEKVKPQIKKEVQENPPTPAKETEKEQVSSTGKKEIKLALKTEATSSEKVKPQEKSVPEMKKEEQKKTEKPEKSEVAKTESQVEKPVEKIAGKKMEETPKRKLLVYHSGEREDPFSPLIGKKSFTLGTAPLPSIEELKLVGVMEDNNGFKALLENELGFGYIMQPGDKIKNGSVVSIDKERIIFQIREYGFTKNIALELFTPNQEER